MQDFVIFVQDYNINLLKHHSRLVHCCTTPFLVCEEWISSIEEKANLSASQKEIVRVIDCFQRSWVWIILSFYNFVISHIVV